MVICPHLRESIVRSMSKDDSPNDPPNDSPRDELIFGKNAVLSFLEQAEQNAGDGDFTVLHQALMSDSLTRGTLSMEDIDDFESRIRTAIKKLKASRPDGTLQLGSRPVFDNTPAVRVNKILLAAGLERDNRIRQIKSLARHQQIPVQNCDRKKLDQIAGPARRHQGVVAMVSAAEMWKLDTFLQKLVLDKILRESNNQSMDGYILALLDGVEDPHNLGAIIRVAEAAGVKGLFIPQRRAAGLTGTVAKTSAGALANLPVVRVGNLTQCLETLKKYGFWVAALDHEAKDLYTKVNLVRPLVVVIGSEGTGVSRLVKEHCDFLVKIPMLGKTESLNASVAAGIMFYEVVRQCLDSEPNT